MTHCCISLFPSCLVRVFPTPYISTFRCAWQMRKQRFSSSQITAPSSGAQLQPVLRRQGASEQKLSANQGTCDSWRQSSCWISSFKVYFFSPCFLHLSILPFSSCQHQNLLPRFQFDQIVLGTLFCSMSSTGKQLPPHHSPPATVNKEHTVSESLEC